MERNGNQEVEKVGLPVLEETFCHPLAEEGAQMDLSFIFPPVNGFP
jgi:hypothetical protein